MFSQLIFTYLSRSLRDCSCKKPSTENRVSYKNSEKSGGDHDLEREWHCKSKVSCSMNTLQCPRSGLKARPLHLESSALAMKPIKKSIVNIIVVLPNVCISSWIIVPGKLQPSPMETYCLPGSKYFFPTLDEHLCTRRHVETLSKFR